MEVKHLAHVSSVFSSRRRPATRQGSEFIAIQVQESERNDLELALPTIIHGHLKAEGAPSGPGEQNVRQVARTAIITNYAKAVADGQPASETHGCPRVRGGGPWYKTAKNIRARAAQSRNDETFAAELPGRSKVIDGGDCRVLC